MSVKQDSLNSIDFSAQDVLTDPSRVLYPRVTQKQLAQHDILDALRKWRIWLLLAYQDIKLRYRRSLLGPLWITISMAISAYTMGFLYSHIFHIPLQKYFPFLVAGMLSWSLLANLLTDNIESWTSADVYLKKIKLPLSLYIHRITARNFIIFFHNLLVLIPVLLFFHQYAKINLNTLLLIPDLMLIYLNGMTYGLILAMIGARFLDISQIIKSLISVIFFVTPVMWDPSALSAKNRYLIDLNPFYAFIELIRAPALGHPPTVSNVLMAITVTLIGVYFSSRLFTRYRGRVVYWV